MYTDDLLLESRTPRMVVHDSMPISDWGYLNEIGVEQYLNDLELPLWYGSNGWVISPEKSESGKVILAMIPT